MRRRKNSRRLIVNADDFGRSGAINHAVVRAHREGILTSASLMLNEAASEEAVALARANPRLGVGLHLTLRRGHSTLPPEAIPDLVNAAREFSNDLVAPVFRYLLRLDLRAQLRAEIHAQFQKFHATGLRLDHVNGHLHQHLHPTIFRILMEDATRLGIKYFRLTDDPFWLNARLASGRWVGRALDALLFHGLAAHARPQLRRRGIRYTARVFGELQSLRVDEAYVSRLLANLPAGDSELYAHPSLDKSRHELEALISPRVKEQIGRLGIELIHYQDL
jgi:hopanoid biosynthesis associated protein HpnK